MYSTLNFLMLLLMINFLGNLIIIDHICQVISRNIGVINRLNFYLPLSSLFHIYHSLLLPYLHYGLLAWGNTRLFYCCKRILLLHKNALHIICKLPVRSHTDCLFFQSVLWKINDLSVGLLCTITLTIIMLPLCISWHVCKK